jgi:hypothetical protein
MVVHPVAVNRQSVPQPAMGALACLNLAVEISQSHHCFASGVASLTQEILR